MKLTAEQIQIASLIDVRVRELAAAGTDDITIFAEMYDYMPGFKRLMDTSARGEMDALCESVRGLLPIRKYPQACGGRDTVGPDQSLKVIRSDGVQRAGCKKMAPERFKS